MSRLSRSFLTTLPLSLLALTATSAVYANTYGQVNKSEWTGEANVPSYIEMFMATPDNVENLEVNPPILVNIHSCGNNAGGQWSYAGFAPLVDAIDTTGYIMIIPQQSRNCWNVGAPESLTHGGGGDTGAIVQMVKYAIETYGADPKRVYAMGGSGGGMAVQALLAVYPEVFRGGFARAGVTAGCWAEGYNDGEQWSGSCAAGSVNKEPQAWGDYVRGINPSFPGPYPRLIVNHGNNDETINFNNFQEGIDEWTNLHGLPLTPTSSESNVASTYLTNPAISYDVQYWEDECGFRVLEFWEALGQGHSMGYESNQILSFFGLDQTRDQDPWDEMCGDFVDPGGTGGADGTGAGGSDAGVGGGGPGAGGMDAGPGAGGAVAAGGATSGVGGGASVGGAPSVGAGGASNTGGAGVSPNTGGAAAGDGGAGATPGSTDEKAGGCSLVAGPSAGGAFAWALVLLGLGIRRRRSSMS